ncbi:MAG: hypothetical protein Q9165_006137 [Trypethelium subeluteriae]
MSSIQLYAELLVHIRAVAFYGALHTEHNHETNIELSADNEWITVRHEGQTASIRLPTTVGGGGNAALTLPAAPSKDITLRLQLEETSPGLLQFGNQQSGNVEPWTAKSLGKETSLYCRDCGQSLLGQGRVQAWKDLPSENWVEMMEFWHCHKPATEHQHANGDAASRKGYSASNKLRASMGTGFVNTSHFLLAPADCLGIEAQKLEKWISSCILAYVENESIRYFHMQPEPSSRQVTSLLLWVFTPDISFSSSVRAGNRQDPTRAMKVMWQIRPHSADQDKQLNFRYEDMFLPASVVSDIKQALLDSQYLLPASSRTFKEWSVGLLPRFTGDDT